MITIVSSQGAVVHLRRGQAKPEIANRIVSITVSGDELQDLKEMFTSLPYNKFKKEMIYKGDFARFLYDNL